MITRLELTNWRNYEHADLVLGPGTTFVVASNGVGKTSLVEAARWALFARVPNASPIRVGADSATALVELTLPDGRVLCVKRELKGSSARASVPHVTLAEDALPATALETILADAYQCTPQFLERITMPAAHDENSAPTSLGLREHLSALYGIDTLDEAIARLDQAIKKNTNEIKALKADNVEASTNLDQLQTAALDTAQRAKAAEDAVNQARERVASSRRWHDYRAALNEWKRADVANATQRDALTKEVATLLGEPLPEPEVPARLEAVAKHAQEEVENLRVNVRVAQAQITSLESNVGRLNAAEHDCPVCRRPLDDNTVAMAHEGAERDMAVLAEHVRASTELEQNLTLRRRQLLDLLSAWQPITPVEPPKAPSEEADPGPDALSLESAEEGHRAAIEASVLARSASAKAASAHEQAVESNALLGQLEALFTKDARLTMAREATSKSRDDLLTDTIHPLAEQINDRWASLFPGRGAVHTRADGTLTRQVNGHALGFESFSTAERTAAVLITRLLVETMTTRANFAWFDEPLEHLDPDVRRHVASVLSRVTKDNAVRQVVVTTYEEPLARKLLERDPEAVTLVDVRPDRTTPS